MEIRKLGRTGLKVAALCLGGNVFGWTCDEETSFAVLDAYVEGGGNFIDTADTYSTWVPGHTGGESEVIIGRWLRARSNRDPVVIATKVGSAMSADPNAQGLSRHHIMASVEASLRRLQTDYIDLYQAHRDDRDTPLDETMGAFADLVHQGKVRYLGASNYSAWRLTRALWESSRYNYTSYISIQPPYNLVNREPYERDLEPLCRELGIGVISYAALAGGFLSGKYRPGQALPQTARAQTVRRRYMNERGFRVLEHLDRVAATYDATPAQIALAWVLVRPGITAPIASATSVAQTRELLRAADLRLDAEAIAALDQASAWQSAE
jgi:aryl-alcohol dehydrogenase-like predicted oxidoreductase